MLWNEKVEATMIERNTQHLELLCLMPAYSVAFADFQWFIEKYKGIQ